MSDAERENALNFNISIDIPTSILNSMIQFIIVVGEPPYSFAPDHGMLVWHLMFMLHGGDCIHARFYAPDNPSGICGILRMEFEPGPFDSTVVCTCPFHCRSQATISQVISKFIEDGISRYSCGDNGRNYAWWCSLVLYRFARAGYVAQSAAIDFRAYVDELRTTDEDLRERLPQIISEGWPTRHFVMVNDNEPV